MIRRESGRAGEAGRTALTAAQWDIYDAGWAPEARFRVAVCGRRFGKALALDTRLPSPDGWTTMGNAQAGDQLFDEAGRPCRVRFVTEVMIGRPCWAIGFADGSEIVADSEHVWPVVVGYRDVLLQTQVLGGLLRDGGLLGVRSSRPVRQSRFECRRQASLLSRLVARYGVQDGLEAQVGGDARLLRRIRRLCGQSGLVTWSVPGGLRWSWQTTDGLHRIVSVTSVESRPVRCLQVDSPSRLFLCGDACIPTHNTFLMAEELRRAARLAVRHDVGIENEIWYGAPTFLQARRVMWARLKAAIPRRWLRGRANETLCTLTLLSGHVIRLVGLDACDNLRGSGLWFFGGDEWADCRPSAWLEVIRPMLSTARGHALFIGTPKGFDHFRDFYLRGQPGGEPDCRSFMFTTEDGGNVPDDELDAARRALDERTFRQEYCASFETYAGRVLYAFSRAGNVRPARLNAAASLFVGMDFNINPMSATVWQQDGDAVCQIDEIILPTSNTDEMAAEIARRYGREGFEPGRRTVDHITVFPDPAGAQRKTSAAGRTDIGILRENGFMVVAPRSHPPVRDRINVMNRLFRSADGLVLATVDPRCVKSIEAYERLVFREGTAEPDKMQGFDHLVDASGYFFHGRQMQKSAALPGAYIER